MASEGSITGLLRDLQNSDPVMVNRAAEQIFNRFMKLLFGVAQRKLAGSPRGAEDEDDAIQSGMLAFINGVREGRFPELHNRENLLRLLLTIVERKAINQRNRQRAHKRGRGRLRGDSAFAQPGDRTDQLGKIQPESHEPTPQMWAEWTEQIDYWLGFLDDECLRSIATMKLEGYTNAEVAAKLNVVERTVERKLNLIRDQLSEALNL